MEKQKHDEIHYQYNDRDDMEILYSIGGKDDHHLNKLNASRNKIAKYPIGTVYSVIFRLLSDIIPRVCNATIPEEYTPVKVTALVERIIDKNGLFSCINFSKIDPARITLIQFFMQFWNSANNSRHFIEINQIWNYLDFINKTIDNGDQLSLDRFHLFCSNNSLPITGFNRKYLPATDEDEIFFHKETQYQVYNKETDELIPIPWQTIVVNSGNEEERLKRAEKEYEADLWDNPKEEDEPNVASYVGMANPKAYYVYDCVLDTFQELFSATTQAIIEQHYTIMKCKGCGEIFVTHRNDAEYCLFSCPEKPKMTCRDYRNHTLRLYKERKDICLRAHAKVDANLRRKAETRDETKSKTRADRLNGFLNESYEWKSSIKSIENYHERMEKTYNYLHWLSKFYSRKYKNNLVAFITDLSSIKNGSDEDNEMAQEVKGYLLDIHERRKGDI